MPTNTYVELKKEVVTGSPVTSVNFDLTGITGYTDLVLVATGTATAGNVNANLRFNGNSESVYSDVYMSGTGSAAQSNRHSNQTLMYLQGYGWWDQTQGNTIVHIMDYRSSTKYKSVLSRANFSNNGVSALVGMWRKTDPITSIEFRADSSTFTVGSTFSLYGIKAVQVYTPSTIPASLNIGDQILVPYTGSATTLSIPAGVNTMRLELAGAAGGGDESPIGAYGGYVAGDYTIGGSALTMYAYIGGKGTQRNDSNISGGFNGGGSAFGSPNGNVGYCAGSGGGGTDIRVGGTALANRIFVAGGGGGGGGNSYQTGGYGGYTTGNPGSGETTPNSFAGARGQGGTQSAGGAGGLGATDGSPAGQAGSLGTGGNGAQGVYGQGGGGGGGYYGGGGGGGANNGGPSGGGGGSSFLGSLTNTTFINGSNNNHGYAILTKVS
jgi:hypothetical protein